MLPWAPSASTVFPCDLVIDEIFTIDDLELTHEIQRFEEFFFPFGHIFLKVKAIQQFLVFEPQFDILGGKAFVQQIPYPKAISARFVHIGRGRCL
jgi:hypothetical protein